MRISHIAGVYHKSDGQHILPGQQHVPRYEIAINRIGNENNPS
jgi:hypothetical protein